MRDPKYQPIYDALHHFGLHDDEIQNRVIAMLASIALDRIGHFMFEADIEHCEVLNRVIDGQVTKSKSGQRS